MEDFHGGANSIELCSDREFSGGITPSYGLIYEVANRFRYSDVMIHVLIRPRAGDFCYTLEEIDVIWNDIYILKNIGIDGMFL